MVQKTNAVGFKKELFCFMISRELLNIAILPLFCDMVCTAQHCGLSCLKIRYLF
jgi:hypothetical protein